MATDHDFKIKNGARVSGEKLILGSSAYSADSDYVGLKTSAMTGSTEYMIISSPGDKHTYISAGSGRAVYIRGGGNNTSHQLVVDSAGASFAGNLTVTGNFTVNGTTTTINSTTLSVDDKNIVLASGAADGAAANGAGITIDGVNATLTYDNGDGNWLFNKALHMVGTQRITTAGFSGIEYHNTDGTWELFVGTENNTGNARYNSRQGSHKFYSNSTEIAHLNSAGLTLDGGTSTTLNVKCDDAGLALIRATGDSQGTGAIEVGQSNSYGGGMFYNGDGSPNFADGETDDHIGFYRMDNGTRTEVFHYPYSSNVVNFNATPTAQGNTIWHAGNDGPSSGLNADLLDGQHASSFVRNDISNSINLTITTLKETDGGDGFTEIGSTNFGYFSWGVEIANPNNGYRAIRFAGKKKYFVLEADVLGTNGANHTGMFWGNADGTAIYAASTTGYKTTHQNSTSFHIRDINTNANQETYNPGFSPADGAWHHQKIMATPDGYVRIWIDGDLKFEETGYIPSAEGYLGFINYAGTVRFANIRCRTINEDEAQHYSQHIGNATSAYADDDRFLKLANNTANSTGTLVTADNGNTWLNADGGKDLWLNWVSLNNKSSKANLQVGDGNYGAAILTVSGSLRRVGINNYNPTYDLDVIGSVGVVNSTGISLKNNNLPSTPVSTEVQLFEENNGLVVRGENTGSANNLTVRDKNNNPRLEVKGGGLIRQTIPGNVADGTYYSGFTMDITGASTFGGMRFDRNGTANYRVGLRSDGKFQIANFNLSSGVDDQFVITTSGNVGVGVGSPADGKLQVYGNSSSDWAGYFWNQHGNGIGLHVETNSWQTEQLLRLSSLNGSGGSNTVKMVVQADGKTGVGTTNFAKTGATLQVKGTSSAGGVSGSNFAGSIFSVEGSSTVYISMGTTGASSYYGWIQAHDGGNGTNYDLNLNPHNGDVGIGMSGSNPQARLHVLKVGSEQSRFAYDVNNYTAVNYNGFNTVGGNMLFNISGTERFRVTSSGATVTGELTLTSLLNVEDIKAKDANGLNLQTDEGTKRVIVYDNGNVVINETGSNADFRVESDLDENMLFVDASANAIGMGDPTPYSADWGTTTATRQVAIRGSNYGVLHIRGSNNNVETRFSMGAGGGNFYPAYDDVNNQHRLIYTQSEAVFNDGGADYDFRVESDTKPNAFLVNAGTNRVGINTGSPASNFSIKADGNGYSNGLTIEDFDSSTRSAITHVDGTFYFSADGTNDSLYFSSAGLPTFTGGLDVYHPSTSFSVKFGDTTQTQYTNIYMRSNSGTGEIWKAGTAYTNFGGASALNIYNSNGIIAFHPQATQNVVQMSSSGMTVADGKRVIFNETSGTLISHGAFSDAVGYNPGYGTYIGAGGRYVYSGSTSTGNSGSHPYYSNGSGIHNITHDGGQINNTYAGNHEINVGATANGGLRISGSSTSGPQLGIRNTGTGGTQWQLISNGSGNTDGAGRLQIWNTTQSFAAATFGHTAGTPTTLYNQKVLFRGSNIGIGLSARPPGSVASFGGGDKNGIFWHSDSGNDYGIYREAGTWTAPYRPLIIRWPVGIKLDADNSDVTILSNVTIDATGDSSRLDMLCANAGNSTLNLMGATGGQGTGVLYVGQSPEYGGGIEYNGDNNPTTSGAGADFVTLFRRDNSTNSWTAKNAYSSNDWQFRGNVTAYASDERLKENIAPINNAVEKVKQLRGVTFDWKDDCEDKGFMPTMKHETGVIAQDVQKVIPDAVSPAPFDNEYLTVQKDKIVPILIEAIKEQQQKIEKLEELVEKLISEK